MKDGWGTQHETMFMCLCVSTWTERSITSLVTWHIQTQECLCFRLIAWGWVLWSRCCHLWLRVRQWHVMMLRIAVGRSTFLYYTSLISSTSYSLLPKTLRASALPILSVYSSILLSHFWAVPKLFAQPSSPVILHALLAPSFYNNPVAPSLLAPSFYTHC